MISQVKTLQGLMFDASFDLPAIRSAASSRNFRLEDYERRQQQRIMPAIIEEDENENENENEVGEAALSFPVASAASLERAVAGS
jgi:hypothetical protein